MPTKVNGVTPQQAWTAWYSALYMGGGGGGGGGGSTVSDFKWVEDCDLPCNPGLVCAPYR